MLWSTTELYSGEIANNLKILCLKEKMNDLPTIVCYHSSIKEIQKMKNCPEKDVIMEMWL